MTADQTPCPLCSDGANAPTGPRRHEGHVSVRFGDHRRVASRLELLVDGEHLDFIYEADVVTGEVWRFDNSDGQRRVCTAHCRLPPGHRPRHDQHGRMVYERFDPSRLRLISRQVV